MAGLKIFMGLALVHVQKYLLLIGFDKVHIFWDGHKILWNLHLTFDWDYIGQK